MSAESKSKIIDRLNRTGRFANKFEPVNVMSKVGPWVPPRIEDRFADKKMRYDPANPKLTITSRNVVSLRQVLLESPTQMIYDLIAVAEEILSTRSDAKR